MLSEQQIFNAVFRDENGNPTTGNRTLQHILNLVFDADNNALRVRGIPAAGLLATGQTNSYHAGDDGDLEKGIAHDYTVLTAGQYSGNTAITINSKTCNLSNNCVKDNNTGLMWARYVPQTDIGAAANGTLFWGEWELADKTTISFDATSKEIRDSASGFSTLALCAGRKLAITGSANNNNIFTVVSITTGVIVVDETITNEAAGATVTVTTVDDLIWNFVDQANANSLGGYTDWWIPNLREIQTIIDWSKYSPAINTTIFPSTPTGSHWSSTSRGAAATVAMYAIFASGCTGNTTKITKRYYCRLCRG